MKSRSKPGVRRVVTVGLVALLGSCLRPAETRFEEELEVGTANTEGISLVVEGGQAAVRTLSPSGSQLWAQAPTLELTVQSQQARSFEIRVLNCMPDSVLEVAGRQYPGLEEARPTLCRFQIELVAGTNALRIAPLDAGTEEAYRFADMGDIQTAMGEVDEVFRAISAVPDLRFVMSTGDVTEAGRASEYQLFQEKLESLDIPFYSTIGNHELDGDHTQWQRLFGRYSVHFRFKGVDFSFVDSGNASIDPDLQGLLATWLDEGKDRIHIFGTHYPLIDPVGIRNGAFRSRNEANKILGMLLNGNIDLALYGHIHSYYRFEQASIPSFISGGGGALPERFDGIGRHFLIVSVDPAEGRVISVERSDVDG